MGDSRVSRCHLCRISCGYIIPESQESQLGVRGLVQGPRSNAGPILIGCQGTGTDLCKRENLVVQMGWNSLHTTIPWCASGERFPGRWPWLSWFWIEHTFGIASHPRRPNRQSPPRRNRAPLGSSSGTGTSFRSQSPARNRCLSISPVAPLRWAKACPAVSTQHADCTG